MITCGIDAGGDCLKVLLLGDREVLSSSVFPYGMGPVSATAQAGLNDAVTKAGIPQNSIDYIAATGSNRRLVSFAHEYILEPRCCAQGAFWIFPSTRTVLDVGSDKCTVLKCDGGSVLRIVRNDKCAAGTGSYLKVISKLLGVTEEEAGQLSLQSREAVNIEATCTVFVESEIISLVHQGQTREDILRGVFIGLAHRIYPLLLKVAFEPDIALIGGLARNAGIIKALEEQIGCSLLIPEEPIVVEALGAAIIAREKRKEVSSRQVL